MSDQASRYVHPLMRRPIGRVTSGPALLEEFTQEMSEEVPDAERLNSILYRVARFAPEDENLILLCLELADGHRGFGSDFLLSEEKDRHRQYDDPSGARLEVARKAFWALCEGVFKDRRKDNFEFPSYTRVVLRPRVFKKILWFIFDNERRRSSSNLPYSRYSEYTREERIFVDFVIKFVELAWAFHKLDKSVVGDFRNDKTLELFQQARPDLVRILYKVRKLDMLKSLAPVELKYYERMPGFSRAELHSLYELAVGKEYVPDNANRWKLIEREMVGGNEAAEFLWCYMPRVRALRSTLSERRKDERERKEDAARKEREKLTEERRKLEERLRSIPAE